MDKELFEGLLTSVREAVAISKGEMEPSRVFRIDPVDIKAIRKKAGLAQIELGKHDTHQRENFTKLGKR